MSYIQLTYEERITLSTLGGLLSINWILRSWDLKQDDLKVFWLGLIC